MEQEGGMIHERVRGDKIKAAREKAGKTEQQVADEIGVSLEYYQFLENGALTMPDKPIQTVTNKQMWDILNAVGGGDPSRITDNTSSHSEKEIYNGCIALMQGLVDDFREWCNMFDISENSDRETAFCISISNMEIVRRLFLWNTRHSGGTSCGMKMDELGIKGHSIKFDAYQSDEDEDEEAEEEES